MRIYKEPKEIKIAEPSEKPVFPLILPEKIMI
jgi:hypothetical protein